MEQTETEVERAQRWAKDAAEYTRHEQSYGMTCVPVIGYIYDARGGYRYVGMAQLLPTTSPAATASVFIMHRSSFRQKKSGKETTVEILLRDALENRAAAEVERLIEVAGWTRQNLTVWHRPGDRGAQDATELPDNA